MNKSKFLKRPLAALLAILMVVALVPMSALAEDEDVYDVFVDTYRATRVEDNFEVEVYDTDDVTISWTPAANTKLQVKTKDNIVKDLPAKLYLAENATLSGETYTVTLLETVGKNDPVERTLKITIKSTVPDNTCTLGGIRVDKTKGKYSIGYLGNGANDVPGYSNPVEDDGIEAHAIRGDITESNRTVTITLPFGMTPEDVGFDTAGISGTTKSTSVFAPKSVFAKSEYTYVSPSNAKVTVTAKSGATKTYTVKFKNEEVFTEFDGATNLNDLQNVSKVYPYGTGSADDGAKYTLNVDIASDATAWVPKFETTAGVQRVMGGDISTEDVEIRNPKLSLSGTSKYEKVNNNSADDNVGMLRLITSEHAKWDIAGDLSDSEYVYFLIRTKANPSGAFVEVKLNPTAAATPAACITEIQAANTQSTAWVPADAKDITVTLDQSYSDSMGGSSTTTGNDATDVYLHITTDKPAIVEIPSQEAVTSTPDSAKKRHLLEHVNAKSKSVTVKVTDVNGRNPRNYVVNFEVARTNETELDYVELRDSKGKIVATSIKQSDKNAPRELEVPFKYFANSTSGQTPANAIAGTDLADLYLCVYPSTGAAVAPGGAATTVDRTNVEVDGSTTHTHSSTPTTAPHVFENGVTTVGDVWVTATGATNFNDTLDVTVSNGGNDTPKTYKIKLKRMLPREEAEIASVETNKALDADYIYSQANTLGIETSGSNGVKQKDVGQAYVGAQDAEGNNLPADVDTVNHAITVTVPADWDADTDTLYLTDLKKTEDTYKVYRYVDNYPNASADDRTVQEAVKSVLLSKEQKDQTLSDDDGDREAYDDYVNGFTKLTTSGGVQPQNILYAVSEKDFWDASRYNGAAPTTEANLKRFATAYNVYIKYDDANYDERELKTMSSADGKVNSVSFNEALGRITVDVPGSTNWIGYRADNSKDFKLNFTTSEGALVIDKYQHNENVKTAGATDTNGAGAANGRYNGSADAQSKYLLQLNERDQWISDESSFFVLDGELYIYDELTGYETPVTGVGGTFTNSNWERIKTKQAEIQVYDENQNDMITYRLDLKVGGKSDKNDITSLEVGGVKASINSDNTITAALPEGSETLQTLKITASPNTTVTVNGSKYLDTLPIDISKSVEIIVTAENGSIKTYTLKVTIGGDTPGPDGKPSDKYDLSDVYSGHLEDVKKAIDMGLMSGTGAAGKFNPKGKIARQDFALIIARADMKAENPDAEDIDALLREKYAGAEEAFNDISGLSDTQKAAVAHCKENGIISGNDKGGFDPKGDVTRQHAAVMIAGWCGLEHDDTANTNNIKDWNNVANWAKSYVNAVYKAGLMSGTGSDNFSPLGNLERQQAATVLVGAYEKKNAEVE